MSHSSRMPSALLFGLVAALGLPGPGIGSKRRRNNDGIPPKRIEARKPSPNPEPVKLTRQQRRAQERAQAKAERSVIKAAARGGGK